MRGYQNEQDQLFFTIDVESRIRPDHPLRPFKKRVDAILKVMTDRFSAAYSRMGRPGVPPEQLLKALLIMAVYSIRSERQLVERIDTDLLFRWFLGMTPEDPVFDATAFTHNRERLEEHGLTAAFFDAVLSEAITEQLCSDDHFSVDGTMLCFGKGIESMASAKSFQPIESEEDDSDADPSDNSVSNGSNSHQRPQSDGNSFKPRNLEVDFPYCVSKGVRNGPTKPTAVALIRKPVCTAKAPVNRPCSLTWGIRSQRTATD